MKNKYVKSIKGQIPYTYKEILIDLEEKNLILTGRNGSGKTSLITHLFEKLNLLIGERKLSGLEDLKERQRLLQEKLKSLHPGTSEFDNYQFPEEKVSKEIQEIQEGIEIDIPEYLDFSEKYSKDLAVILFFDANRIAKITHAESGASLSLGSQSKTNWGRREKVYYGERLEQHLVNLKMRRALAIVEENNTQLANQIENWFENFNGNLKLLLEDESTNLLFDPINFKFLVSQSNKPTFSLQNLSSGFSAVFNIFSEIFMHSEHFSLSPDALQGVVFIDEIDVHLHVSLQKRIFPFLTNLFPSIQFIVTTHSPFVLTSVSNSVIYDLNHDVQIDDLSLFSYNSVLEGLFDVKVNSLILESMIKQISDILNDAQPNYELLGTTLKKIEPYQSYLDTKSKSYYLLGVNKLLDKLAE